MNLDLIIAIIFGITFLIFAIITRNVKSFASFSISNKDVSFLLIFASISATFIGPGFSLSFVRKGYETGFLFLVIGIAYGLQAILNGIFVAPKIREKFSDSYSIGDIIGGKKSHNNIFVHLLSGIIAFGLTVGFSVVMAKAGGEILNNFLGVPIWQGIIILTLIVTTYSYFGGIKATIYTDALQFVLFVLLIPSLILFIIFNNSFDYSSFYNNAISITQKGFLDISVITFIGLFVSFLFGETLIPPLINRILASKSKKISSKAFIYSGLFFFVWLFLMLFIGVFGYSVLESIPNDQILLELGNHYYNFGLFGLFSVAMIGIVMSSQDSLINSGATVFTRDIANVINRIRKMPDLSLQKQLLFSKIATVLIGLFSVVFGMFIPSILEGLLFIYSIWAPSMLVILLASVFLNKHYWQAGLFSMISGILTSVIWNILKYDNFFPTILI